IGDGKAWNTHGAGRRARSPPRTKEGRKNCKESFSQRLRTTKEGIMKKKCIRFISLAIFLALAGPAWGSHAAGECGDTTHNGGDVPCSCGDTVTTDTVLDSGTDLVVSTVCTCNGLDVADGVELDLGGNTITGSE